MKKIMIADSIRSNCEMLKRALAAHGFPSFEVSRGNDVVMLNHRETLMVLISQNLQDMSAFEALEGAKRENPYFSEVPFIICTSDNSEEFNRRCISSGFKGVLYRPFSRKSLFNLIKSVMIENGLADEDMFMGEAQVEAINDEERLEFLRHFTKMNSPVIVPEYNANVNTGYSYPVLTEFFALEPGEEYDLLRTYTSQNIFNQNLENRVNLCPRCSFHTINFRETCSRCGALDIHVEEVFHHFSCGYVGPISDFTGGVTSEFICPKCSKKLRHIGLDYEKPTNTYVCHNCEYVFNDPKINFNCFHCGYVGEGNEAVVSSIFSFTPGPKALKIVERNSFDVFQLEELLTMADYACSSMDFFTFMLRRNFMEAKEYGDSLFMVIIGIRHTGEEIIKALLEFVAQRKRTGETVTLDPLRRVLMAVPREREETLIERGRDIQAFIRSFEHQPPYSACVFVRRLDADTALLADTMVKQVTDDFETSCRELPEEIVVYENSN